MPFYTMPSLTVGSQYGRSSNVLPPIDYRSDRSYPLLLCLHSYGATGVSTLTNFGLNRANNFDDGCVVWAPTGTLDGASTHWKYWVTGTNSDFEFLSGTIVEIKQRFNISYVFGVGYSNGAFMINQLAQQYPGLFHSIVICAAADGENDPTGSFATPLPVLHIYSNADLTVNATGSTSATSLPGALAGHGGVGSVGFASATQTAANWAARNGLGGSMGPTTAPFDLVTTGVPATTGSETTGSQWTGAVSTNMVEQWMENAVGHSSVATLSSFRGSWPLFAWLLNNRRSL